MWTLPAEVIRSRRASKLGRAAAAVASTVLLVALVAPPPASALPPPFDPQLSITAIRTPTTVRVEGGYGFLRRSYSVDVQHAANVGPLSVTLYFQSRACPQLVSDPLACATVMESTDNGYPMTRTELTATTTRFTWTILYGETGFPVDFGKWKLSWAEVDFSEPGCLPAQPATVCYGYHGFSTGSPFTSDGPYFPSASFPDLTVVAQTVVSPFAASSAVVTRGARPRLSGTVTRFSLTASTTGGMVAYRSRVLDLYFDRSGPTPPVLVARATTDSRGRFTTPVTVPWTGTWYAVLPASGNAAAAQSARTSVLVRGNATRLVTLAATPRPVHPGGVVTVAGRLDRLSTAGSWGPLPGARAQVWFDPAGPGAPALVRTVSTSRTGAFRVATRQRVSGAWYVVYAGSTQYAYARSPSVPSLVK